MPDHLKILLSEQASAALLSAGECFVICGKSSHPEIAGRIVLHLLPLEKQLADQLCEIALGQRRPGRRIIPPAITTDALTLTIDGKDGT